MKARIQIKTKTSDYIPTSCIFLKSIQHVVIDGITYYKSNYKTSIEISNFYYHIIKKNYEKITEIKVNDRSKKLIVRLKNGFLHSIETFAYENMYRYYYIDGVRKTEEEWKLLSRRIKIENIIQNIKK
jgi:hypothetical protein